MPKVKISELTPHPRNPHKGHDAHVREGLEELGQYKPIVVNKGTLTGRPNEILAGHTTTRAAKSLGWDEIEVKFVDVDDEKALRILVYDNGVQQKGTDDARMLEDILKDLPDLVATSFVKADMDKLMRETASLADHAIGGLAAGLASARESQGAPALSPAGSPVPAPAPPLAAVPGAPEAPAGNADGAHLTFTHGDPASGEEVRPPVAPVGEAPTAYFSLSYTVTLEQRQAIQSTLNRIAAELGTGATQATALVHLCRGAEDAR